LNEFESTLERLVSLLKANSIDYVIIGGAAAIIHGRLRTTEDIDVTLLTDLEDLGTLYKLISSHYCPIWRDSENFFKKNFVLPVFDEETKVRIDFAAGLSEFDRKVLERKVQKKIGKILINICSVEDLIIYKLISARPQDLLDIEALLKINKDNLDQKYMKSTAKAFIEAERSDVLENLNKYLQRK
jgi:predicted nucleotidyltransferase